MFIALNADNGFGIYDNKTKLDNAKEWMRKPLERVL